LVISRIKSWWDVQSESPIQNDCSSKFYDLNRLIVYFQAIQNPQDEEFRDKAWRDVIPLVEELRKYYEFSLLLGKIL